MNRVRLNRAINHIGGTSFIRTILSSHTRTAACACLSVFFALLSAHTTHAAATQSWVSLSVNSNLLTINIIPSPNGTFGSSADATILVNTNNYSGYTLSIKSDTTTDLININNDTIPTIGASITEQTFRNDITYKNKWGYKPSQYITTSNDVNTVVQNTNYLPAPSTTGQILDITNIANSTNNSYTVSFGAKVGYGQPAGTYDYTYIISAVGNADAFNINYQANTEDTVNNMPSPNPQVLQIQAGTPVVESVTTLSNTTPTRTGYTFAGWCDVATTFNTTTKNQECSGTTYAAGANYGLDQTADGTNILLYAIWNINSYTFEFDEQGGSTVSDITRKYGETIGEGNIPVSVKNDLKLEGWYPNTNYNEAEKLTEDTQVTSNETYYAHWVTTLFPVVWNHMGACEFHGATNGNITGTECTEYSNDKFIDTGIALFNQANYQKDFEIHLTIDHYDPSEQVNYYGNEDNSQQTFINAKLSSTAGDGKAAGVNVRRNGNTNIQVNSKLNDTQEAQTVRASSVQDLYVYRLDNKIYYAVNEEPLVFLQDITGFNQQFGLNTWFGAYPSDNCTGDNGPCTNGKRIPEATFSNMYIRMGEYSDDDIHTITFNANGGTPATTVHLIKDDNTLKTLPTTPNYTDHIFQGWYTGQNNGTAIGTSTQPDSSTTYYAHWLSTVTLANITNSEITLEQNETETINVTNSAELEPYTFSSNDTSVATVDPNTGEITAVGAGSTTIVMTGSTSGATKNVLVVVSGQVITLTFDAQGGSSVGTREVGEGGAMNNLPSSQKTDYRLEGWYTGQNGTGTKLTTSTVFTTSTPTTYYANWTSSVLVCKIAKTLHEETCGRTDSGKGCLAAGYAYDEPITYGNIVESTTMNYGDAYDCDVNGNTDYNAENERFYYIGTREDSTTHEQFAILVYYKDQPDDDNYTYSNASNVLPDNTLWSNPDLIVMNNKVARFMTVDEVTTICSGTTEIGYKIGNTSKGKCGYIGENTRFAYQTVKHDTIWLQQVNGSNRRVNLDSGQQIQSPNSNSRNGVRPVIEVPLDLIEEYSPTYAITFNPHNNDETSPFTIDITIGDALGADYPTDPTYTDHLFQGWYTAEAGGTLVTSATEPSGNTTYHAQWKGTVALANISNTTINIIEGNTATINVTNSAEIENYSFSSNNQSVATVNSSTGVVSAVEEGTTTIVMTGATSGSTKNITIHVLDQNSAYTLEFDPENGEPIVEERVIAIGDQIGSLPAAPSYTNHVFQGWFENTSGGTALDGTEYPNGNKTYHAQWKLDVTQAIISNNDLTVSVGGQIPIGVSNSAALEGYTFSSSNANIATVDPTTGVITGVGVGTTNIIMTGTQSNLTKSIEVDITAAAATMYEVTFDAKGGTLDNDAPSTIEVEDGDPVGTLPTATKANHRFFGWYADDGTFYEEVYPEEIIDSNVTFYARWIEDTTNFPIQFAVTNACEFDVSSHISGTYCLKDEISNNSLDLTKTYIDTGIALYDTAAKKNVDYEIGFTIVNYDYNPNNTDQTQITFMSIKKENSAEKWPGLAVRRMDKTTRFEFTHSKNVGTKATHSTIETATVHHVKVIRQNDTQNNTIKIKYSVNNGTLTDLQDVTDMSDIFPQTVWFGASAKENGTPQRQLTGKLTDMYVKVGAITEYVIDLDGNGGTFSGSSSRTITVGQPVGALPTPTHPNQNYTFAGWYNEDNQLVNDGTSYIPTKSETLTAHWTYAPSLNPVTFEVSNAATRGYNTIVNGYMPQIAQFNKDTTTVDSNHPTEPSVNFSTWGIAKATYHSALQTNFETNNCMLAPGEDSQIDWGGGHTVNCSKPDVYDTNIGSALNVYLWDTTNQTKGAQVYYTKASDGVIRNMIPGKTYYWEKANDNTVYGVVTATSVNNRRWLDVTDVWNVRDLGGLPVDTNNDGTIDGHLDYGILIRGGRLNSNSNTITELTNLGVDKEYDLANSGELSPPDVQFSSSNYVNDTVVHYKSKYGTSDYAATRQAVTDVMNEVINGNNIFFHCRVGADRTGTLAYILEGLLGVPNEYRYEDYELTSIAGLNDRTRYYRLKSYNNDNFYKFLYMMDFIQSTQDIRSWYLAGSADTTADEARITNFRNAMIVNN